MPARGRPSRRAPQRAIPELARAKLPPAPPSVWLVSRLGSWIDEVALGAGQVAIDATVMPRPDEAASLARSAGPLADPQLLREPGRFFDFGSQADAGRTVRTLRRRPLPGGSILTRTLAAEYRSFAGDAVARDPLRFEHWRHADTRGRATLVALHGFLMGQPLVDALALFAPRLFRLGLDVVLPTLPYHGARTPASDRVSGQRFAVPDVARMGDAVRRAVFETRVLMSWLAGESAGPVGLMGLSLGAYLTALCVGLYRDLAFAVTISPPACIGDLAWRSLRRSRLYRSGVPAALSRQALRRTYRVLSPLAHRRRISRERILIVARRGDRVVPPEHPYALWLHWGRPEIRWLAGGHLAPIDRGRIVEAVAWHLHRLRCVS